MRVHLEAVDLELIGLDQAGLGEPVADFVPLIALQLQDLAILWVLYHGAVAGELLQGARGNSWVERDIITALLSKL